ncbi:MULTISPECIES: hypothetical protein [unclassified Paenarthrobacter]|nr:hypothetical protein [Paenarthrobacter sp. AR 02]
MLESMGPAHLCVNFSTQVKHVMFELEGLAEKDWHRTIFTLR